jgi:hypothetical protein
MQSARQAYRDCKRSASAPVAVAAGMSGLGLSMDPHTRDKTAAYALGIGTMGVIGGLGLGGKPNTLILLVGIGSLIYANVLAKLVDVSPRGGVSRSITEFRERLPSLPRRAPAPRASFDLY